MINGCLVLEGGAYRGVYEEGILDVLMENDLYFSCVIGVSAGALNAISYLARQVKRSANINIEYRHDKRYINELKLFKKEVVNLDFLFDEANKKYPLDMKTFMDSPQKLVVVATDCTSGKAKYFIKGECDIFEAVKASASMPFISNMVMIDGVPYLDGGCADKIPYRWAIDEGYDKIVVLRTRDRGYRKSEDLPEGIIERFYKGYPAFAKVLADTNRMYNEECDNLDILTKLGIIFTIGPSEPLNMGRLERDVDVIKKAYEKGREDAQENLEALYAYLGK